MKHIDGAFALSSDISFKTLLEIIIAQLAKLGHHSNLLGIGRRQLL
ncbi:MAG TPA: hypothetical protein VF247_01525 [Candidatus Krumholzibacteria bacterium]